MSTIQYTNICFEYLLKKDDIFYYDELIDRDKFKDITENIYKISNEWYMNKNLDTTLYKDISIGNILQLETFYGKVEVINFLMVLFSIDIKYLKIHISKNFYLDAVFIDILKLMNIKFEIIIINKKGLLEYTVLSESIQDPFLKNLLRKSILFLNNFLKSFSKKERCFFQGYHSTLKLIDNFDNHLVVDNFPRKIKNIFSLNAALYFIPSTKKSSKIKKPLRFSGEINFNSIVKDIFINDYLNKKDEISIMIDSTIIFFNKYNVKKAVVMTPSARMPNIIKQYFKKINGEVALYNHGVISYSLQRRELIGIDTIFTWSDYESNIYKNFSKNIIKTGYPVFTEMKNCGYNKNNKKKYFSEMIVTIIALSSSESLTLTRSNIINTHKALIKMLLNIGFKKQNIKFKMHPGRANKDFYIKIYEDVLFANNIMKDNSIMDVIESSDIIIGGASTVIYEASFLDKPYYTYEPKPDILKSESIFKENYINATGTLHGLEENIINGKSQDIKIFKEKALYSNNYIDVFHIIKKEFIKNIKE